jgi:hypothetical protein
MSGSALSSASIAERPFEAVATTSIPLSVSQRAISPRATTESSAMRTRVRLAETEGAKGA